jgi:hypothetical protein
MAEAVIPGRAEREPGISILACVFFIHFEIPGLVLRTIPE